MFTGGPGRHPRRSVVRAFKIQKIGKTVIRSLLLRYGRKGFDNF